MKKHRSTFFHVCFGSGVEPHFLLTILALFFLPRVSAKKKMSQGSHSFTLLDATKVQKLSSQSLMQQFHVDP